MYKLKTHVLVIGLMTGMMADFYGHGGIAGLVVLVTFLILHII